MNGLLVKSRVKELIKEKGMRSKPEAIRELGERLEDEIDRAVERARANGRSTVYPQDV